MDNLININVPALNKPAKVRDSLELVKGLQVNKLTKNLHQLHKSVSSLCDSTTLDDEGSNVLSNCHDSCGCIDTNSSIEETRHLTASSQIRTLDILSETNSLVGEIEQTSLCRHNSTFNNISKKPIFKYNSLEVSPIKGSKREKPKPIQKEHSQKVNNPESSAEVDVTTHLTGNAGESSSEADDWLPSAVSQSDPAWLNTPSPNLHSLPPKTYTPRNLRTSGRNLLKEKARFRTSSPAMPKASPIAKKALIENLDLSAIPQDDGFDSSIELVPRPPTPGTVNSDEIHPFTLSISRELDANWSVELHDSGQIKIQQESAGNKRTSFASPTNSPFRDVIEFLPSPVLNKPVCAPYFRGRYGNKTLRDVLEKN